MNNNLKLLGIVMLTYNRKKYALRAMNYWNKKGIKLYVIDGSEKKLESNDLDKFDNNIIYINDQRNYRERLISVLNKVEEPYLSMISDDEFLVPSSLSSCINFLEKNKDYVTCTGIPILFDYSKSYNELLVYPIYKGFQNQEYTNNSSSKRILKKGNNIMPLAFYAVNRVQTFKNALEAFSEKDFKFFCQHEIQIELMTCFSGKTKILNNFHWMRSNENLNISSSESNLDRSNSFERFWEKELDEKKLFLKIMASHLKKGTHKSVKNIMIDLENTLNIYHKVLENKKLKPSFNIKQTLIYLGFKKIIPKKFLEYYRFRKNNISNIKDIYPKETYIDKEFISEIKSLISKFYINI